MRKRVLALDENDPHGVCDPIWYDRAEPETAPGLVLNAAAYLFLWLVAGLMVVARLYWLPETIWGRISGHLRRRREMGDKRL